MLSDSTHYFVRQIDVYQVTNAVNINIYARYANLPTAIKAVVNGIIATGVGNDYDGAGFFLDNLYACPNLLAILEEDLNVLICGTCWNKRKCFSVKDERINIQGVCERGPSNAIKIVNSILLLHYGNIPKHSNSSAVSGD